MICSQGLSSITIGGGKQQCSDTGAPQCVSSRWRRAWEVWFSAAGRWWRKHLKVRAPERMLLAPPLSQDESARLFSTPKDVFRLTQIDGEQRAGGGALVLAAARPQDTWQTVLEVRPSERGVSARDGELPSDRLARQRWPTDGGATNHAPSRFASRARMTAARRWSQASTPVDTSGKTFDPRLAWAKEKSIVVVWSDERRGNRHFDIFARRSPDGGVTWEAEQLLSRFPKQGPTDLHARPVLASDGGDRLWTVWVGVRSSKSYLFLNRSRDGGRTWTEPVRLRPVRAVPCSVSVLLHAGDRMLLIWHDTLADRPHLCRQLDRFRVDVDRPRAGRSPPGGRAAGNRRDCGARR